jgi:hypothetical protein
MRGFVKVIAFLVILGSLSTGNIATLCAGTVMYLLTMEG